MRVLVLNSGSSSLKFRLFDVPGVKAGGSPQVGRAVTQGAVKGIGGTATLEIGGLEQRAVWDTREVHDHVQALRWVVERLSGNPTEHPGEGPFGAVEAVGHRVVHGGDRFTEPVVITDAVEKEIDALSELAPLHNPACLAGIRGARAVLGSRIPMVAVFDTAFHRSLPDAARLYALPLELADRHHIRRYGFHGIAHASLAAGYAAHSGRPLDQSRLITLQLGNGCSITAIAGGRSVDTSMGFTPLEGLVMGTRTGDVDPTVVSYLAERERVPASDVEQWLNERSGLLGLSGRTNDMRELLRAASEERDSRAELAIELFCYRARKYLGAYLAALGGADAVVFGGGIGEAAPVIRARICEGMVWCGLRLDPGRNDAAVRLEPGRAARISADGTRPEAYVVAADEETWIARETARCVRAAGRGFTA